MNTQKCLTSALFAAVLLGLGLAPPAHGKNAAFCQVVSDDGVAPMSLHSSSPIKKVCLNLGYQAGCTFSVGQTGCDIAGKTVTVTLSNGKTRLSFDSKIAIQRVLLNEKNSSSKTCSYNYNPSDDLDVGLAAPDEQPIAFATFCADPVQTVARDLKPCPFSDSQLNNTTDGICGILEDPLYFVVNSLEPGVPPAICPCGGATVTSCESSPGLAGSCFLSNGRGVFESLAEDIIKTGGSNCAVHCFPSYGTRRCKEICQ